MKHTQKDVKYKHVITQVMIIQVSVNQNNNRCMYKTKQIQWQLISIKILDMVNI